MYEIDHNFFTCTIIGRLPTVEVADDNGVLQLLLKIVCYKGNSDVIQFNFFNGAAKILEKLLSLQSKVFIRVYNKYKLFNVVNILEESNISNTFCEPKTISQNDLDTLICEKQEPVLIVSFDCSISFVHLKNKKAVYTLPYFSSITKEISHSNYIPLSQILLHREFSCLGCIVEISKTIRYLSYSQLYAINVDIVDPNIVQDFCWSFYSRVCRINVLITAKQENNLECFTIGDVMELHNVSASIVQKQNWVVYIHFKPRAAVKIWRLENNLAEGTILAYLKWAKQSIINYGIKNQYYKKLDFFLTYDRQIFNKFYDLCVVVINLEYTSLIDIKKKFQFLRTIEAHDIYRTATEAFLRLYIYDSSIVNNTKKWVIINFPTTATTYVKNNLKKDDQIRITNLRFLGLIKLPNLEHSKLTELVEYYAFSAYYCSLTKLPII